jgi:hypothetical protein
MLRPGDVVICEGGFDLQGRLFKWACRSPWTHTFLVIDQDTLIESVYSAGVRTASLPARLAELRAGRRSYVVKRAVDLTPDARIQVAEGSRQFLGRLYDPLQAVLWFFSDHFWWDGNKRLICSRFVTAAFRAAGYPLFVGEFPKLEPWHADNLRKDYAHPKDILYYSRLKSWAVSYHGSPDGLAPWK